MVCPLWEWYLQSTGLYPSHTHHLLASRCLACQSPTPGIDIHSCQDIHPRNHKYNIPFIPPRSYRSKLQRIQVISAKESGVIFFNIYIREKKEVHSASLKSCKLWSSNKTKFHPNGMPPISSSPDIPSFIRPEFG